MKLIDAAQVAGKLTIYASVGLSPSRLGVFLCWLAEQTDQTPQAAKPILHSDGTPLTANELLARTLRDVAKTMPNQFAADTLNDAADQLDMTNLPKLVQVKTPNE